MQVQLEVEVEMEMKVELEVTDLRGDCPARGARRVDCS